MARTKVFVGNLAFKTREPNLTQEFETAGKVISATIVTRKGRSLGYGFVEFESEASAAKAVQALNKKEIDGRQVNVEIAKPRDENAPRPPPQNYSYGFRRGGGNFRRGGGGGFRGRYPRGNYGYGYNSFRGSRGGNFRRGGGYSRPPRPSPEERNFQPSSTTLYVTNLPFSLTNESFLKLFTDANVKPKSVKIIMKHNGKSRGYGFAEFENNADQQKGLALNKKTIEGREIVVKVALVPPAQPQTAQAPQTNQTGQTPSPSQTTSNTQGAQKPAPSTNAQQGKPANK